MKKQDLKRFFVELSKEWKHPAAILLIGGGGALVMGGVRPTLDVDFEVKFRSKVSSWDGFQEAVRRVSAKTGIGAQYAESIERWSEITLLDYRKHSNKFECNCNRKFNYFNLDSKHRT